jgi:hypothetical protein
MAVDVSISRSVACVLSLSIETFPQICLPASALHALQFKGAMDHRGAMFFELTTREARKFLSAATERERSCVRM